MEVQTGNVEISNELQTKNTEIPNKSQTANVEISDEIQNAISLHSDGVNGNKSAVQNAFDMFKSLYAQRTE